MKRNSLCMTVAIAAIAIASRPAFAQMFISAGPPGPPPPMAAMLAGLSLTPQQQTAISAIMKSHQQSIAPLMNQLHNQHQQVMATLLAPGQVGMSDLTPLEQEAGQTEQQLPQEMLKTALDIRAVLTPDQLAQAAAKQKKLDAIHEEMRSVMGPPPGAPGGGM